MVFRTYLSQFELFAILSFFSFLFMFVSAYQNPTAQPWFSIQSCILWGFLPLSFFPHLLSIFPHIPSHVYFSVFLRFSKLFCSCGCGLVLLKKRQLKSLPKKWKKWILSCKFFSSYFYYNKCVFCSENYAVVFIKKQLLSTPHSFDFGFTISTYLKNMF